MKSNILNYITKRTSLVLALIALPCASPLNATDYVVSYNESFSTTEANGSFTFNSGAYAQFYNAALGNSSGGRFTMRMNNAVLVETYNTTMYTDSFFFDSGGSHWELFNSYISVDNSITLNSGYTFNLLINSNSTFAGRSISENGGTVGLKIENNSHLISRLNLRNLYMRNSEWTSNASSKINYLDVANSTINLVVSSLADRLEIGTLYMEYISNVTFNVGFTDAAIVDILAGIGEWDIVMDDTIVISSIDKSGDSNIYYNIATSSDSYQWDVVDLGHKYVIKNITPIVVVPEPSTYAAIFGVLALAWAIYRRCK